MPHKFIFFLRTAILFIFSTAIIQSSFAQGILKGKVTDNKNKAALSGAAVYIPDLKMGAVAKADGSYEIKNNQYRNCDASNKKRVFSFKIIVGQQPIYQNIDECNLRNNCC